MRRSRDRICMDAAYLFSTRSTCSRLGVGSVIAIDGRIISTGYNGAPSGLDHCDHTCIEADGCTTMTHPDRHVHLPDVHAPGCPAGSFCDETVHAEANAIAFAARYGTPTLGASLYTTTSPCRQCAKLIINAGLSRVVYGEPYRDTSGLMLLALASVEGFHLA